MTSQRTGYGRLEVTTLCFASFNKTMSQTFIKIVFVNEYEDRVLERLACFIQLC